MRYDIINQLITENNYQTYLEIGAQNGFNFKKINIAQKMSIDPDPESAATEVISSDDFFAKNTKTFDIIFVDGLHHWEQVERDIINSLKCLNDGGTIVCHDMKPENEEQQIVPRISKAWTGDCWRAWVKLRTRDDLEMFVYDTDHGVGVIKKGKQIPIDTYHLMPYATFDMLKDQLLNLKPWHQK